MVLTCFHVLVTGVVVEVVAVLQGCAVLLGSAVLVDSAEPSGCAAVPWGSVSLSLVLKLDCSALHNGKLEIKELSPCGI